MANHQINITENGTKTLTTAGKYCDRNIDVNVDVNVEINSKSYEVTLTKQYGQILLATLDDEVLTHINDDSLVVTLNNMSPYVQSTYTGYNFFVRNVSTGSLDSLEVYGVADRVQSSGAQVHHIYYPANYTGTDTSKGGYATFHCIGGKYYITPGDGYIAAGTYRLTFTW